MIDSHTEQEGKTALTDPPTPAAPMTTEEYRPPAPQAWRSLGLVALGMLLAVGGMAGFTMYHARPVASQSRAATPDEAPPAAATVAIPDTHTSRKIGPGQFIRQDNTDPLLVIADLTKMWMLANVYEADVPWIHVGQPVEVQVLAYPTEVFKAMITYIGATVDPATHRVDVRAVVDNSGRKLKPDIFATFWMITRADATYASVPASAVVRDGDKAYVWVGQPEQQFVRREIRVGLAQEGYVQMVSGVQPGEQVAAEGGLLLGSAAGS